MKHILSRSTLQTPLGQMIVLADDKAIHFLQFASRKDLDLEIATFLQRDFIKVVDGKSKAIELLELELKAYFEGKSLYFKTPICPKGSELQTFVWSELLTLKLGQTVSYSEFAKEIGLPKAVRAITNAIAKNPIAIMIPCHRVIGKSGQLTGYNAGIEIKKALLELEVIELKFKRD